MGLITDHSGPADEYEAIDLPVASSQGAAVFVRRSARPSRRAVLHLHQLADSFAPADLVRWYNERGFHFYLTDAETGDADTGKRRPAKSGPAAFDALDAACGHLRETDGIDAIILSAQGSSALTAALWCDARPVSRPVDALILSGPDFGRVRARLDITCPVLVISTARPWRGTRRERRGSESVKLGQHVTWLHIDASASVDGPPGAAPTPGRRRLFDEMGRWLGAYMYGQVRDQLL
jgi:alpha-beta hydrolase superfamily lysophospholipase